MTSPSHFIRAWRKARGLTQQQLADQVGIDRSYLSNIETGRRRYDQPFLEAAAARLRCTPADLISRDPANGDDLEQLVASLSGDNRERALDVLRAMFKR